MGEKPARLNSGPSKLSHQERIDRWVEIASIGCIGIPDGSSHYAMAKAAYTYEDHRTPLERFTAMKEQAKQIGIYMSDDFVCEVTKRLPDKSVYYPPRRKK